jgi:serine/threonine protein kinase
MGTNRRRTEDQVSADSIQPGCEWGNFTLARRIGEGSSGEVYLAHDSWLGHDIALKILRARVAEKAKMLHEARMLVRVRHSHVVTVHGADVHDGRLGFWMDFVDGLTLKEVILRGGPRSAGEAGAWGQDLCRALAAVHAAEIVHRGVKAQNVMRQAHDGRLILMDFGAGELHGQARSADAGAPVYMAPELLDGGVATPSSDIYALGVLLFHVVSMRFPHEGETREELVEAHARGRRVRLEDVRPDLPSCFVEVVERAISRNPAVRYASAGEMLAALRACSDTEPLQVTPLEPRVVAPGRAPAVVGRFVLRLSALGKAARLVSADGVRRRVAGAVALILGLAQLMAVTVR